MSVGLPFNSTSCEICQVSFNGPNPAKQHYASKGHRKKSDIAKLVAEHDSSGDSLSNVAAGRVFCKWCHIFCDTKQMLDEHELTAKHLAVVEKRLNPMGSSNGNGTLIFFPELGHRDNPSLGSSLSQDISYLKITEDHKQCEYASNPEEVKLQMVQLNNSSSSGSLSSSDIEPISKPCNNSDEKKEYEFTAYGRGNCFACNIDLTSVSMTKEHIRGQKHLNAKKHWLIERQCGLRNKRIDKQNGTLTSQEEEEDIPRAKITIRDIMNSVGPVLSNSDNKELIKRGFNTNGTVPDVNAFSMALGIDDLELADGSLSHESHNGEVNVEQSVCAVKPSDSTRTVSSKHKQSPSDKTTWFTCPVCIKKLNSEKMRMVHMRTHPGRSMAESLVVTVHLNGSVCPEVLEDGLEGRKELATKLISTTTFNERLEPTSTKCSKLQLYARNGEIKFV